MESASTATTAVVGGGAGNPVIKAGNLKKRSARMHQWSTRYIMLHHHSIGYKLKPEATQVRGLYDLVPGCIVTPIESESRGTIKGKKIYSFWVRTYYYPKFIPLCNIYISVYV
jgi:hypothetical protein